ncbi:hypothetical protein M3Y95_00777300 [Aphelenchoides besseyi]|nr:hypothetical protein M3Y95_00777300 [Aphelenchoides besseyi]
MAWFRGSNSRSIDSSFPTPRSARPYIPSDMSGNLESMMVDMLLNEIQTHISRLEDEQEKQRQESLKETRQPDYGWLMDWKLKTKKTLSFRECSAIEMICQKIRPNEWGALIREFRQRVQFIRNRDDVVNTFRAVVDEILNERCASQNSVRLVDELLNSPNSTNWRVRPQTAAAHVMQSQQNGARSFSIEQLSAATLSPRHFNETHEIV